MPRTNPRKHALALGALLATCTAAATAQSSVDLEHGFQSPPASAHPRVWWHWMNGNITREGIGLDIDWMHRVGIVGFQNFDVALNTPQVVDKRLVYMTPEWKAAFLYSLQKADSYGMETAVAGSPGWSESGGPWVKPQDAMKKLVWSETSIEGGKPFHGVLAPAPTVTGPFGNLLQQDLMGAMAGDQKAPAAIDYGADVAVIAYKQPADDQPIAALKPVITTSAGEIDGTLLYDNDLNHDATFPAAAPGQKSWIQYAFPSAAAIQAATLVMGGPRDPLAIFAGENDHGPQLESSEDGITFTPIARFPTSGSIEHTLSFAPVTARYFRLTFLEAAPASTMQGDIDLSEFGGAGPKGPRTRSVAEFQLHTGPRINRFEEKAAFAAVPDLYSAATTGIPADTAIRPADVIDLTAKMGRDGTLDWTPPAGRWTILRMGYSLTGITNHPAPAEATGPEVDKLSKPAVKAYITHYLDQYADASGGMMGKRALKYVITDSWEAGTQNWTDDMVAQFTTRRGYSPLPWMPTLAGRVVGSASESDRFLWDFRRTIAELLAENHYGTINQELHARGLGQYGESHESGRATIGDGMEMKRADDVPMAAMWTQRPGVDAEQYGYNADIRESASVAHIYGQNLVAAESLTAAANPWGWSPAFLKPTADKELAMGLNRFVIHSSVHQPLIGKAPGLALGPFGQWFNRNEIWAEQAGPWIDYLARSSYLLQQGTFIADIAYFYGEDSNLTAIFANKSPDVPEGFNFDYVNANALIHKLHVKDHVLVTDSGMKYRVLVLDAYSTHMSLPVLRQIKALVAAGATVIGQKPTGTPSLADKETEFHALADELWSGKLIGKGKVIATASATEALAAAGVQQDFSLGANPGKANVLYVHRRTADADIFYVDNRKPAAQAIEASFAVTGKSPELWHADTGLMEPASFTIAGGRTTVPLKLDPYGTVFVVFRKSTKELSKQLPEVHRAEPTTLTGPWQVAFEPGRGAPASATFDKLASFAGNPDPGIRYFSGHATYSKAFDATPDMLKPGARVWIDLGEVANLAEVTLNGKPLGEAWKPPFEVDATGALKPGSNTLEIRVADLWVNRLIGDQQPGAATKYTFTARNPYKANSPLVPAGLIGPVTIVHAQ